YSRGYSRAALRLPGCTRDTNGGADAGPYRADAAFGRANSLHRTANHTRGVRFLRFDGRTDSRGTAGAAEGRDSRPAACRGRQVRPIAGGIIGRLLEPACRLSAGDDA